MKLIIFSVSYKNALLILLVFMYASLFAQKELDLDQQFIDKSNRWTPKVQLKMFGYPKASFGPFKIEKIEKTNNEKLKSNRSKGIFFNEFESNQIKTLSINILYNKTEKIKALCYNLETETSTSQTWLTTAVIGENRSIEYTQNRCLDIFITLPNDTISYHYSDVLKDPNKNEKSKDYYGKLITNKDTLEVYYTRGYKDGPTRLKNNISGIKILENNNSIAALQFNFKQYIWLSKEIEEQKQMLLGSLIAIILSTKENN